MSDYKIKQRQRRAYIRAVDSLKGNRYRVVKLDGHPFHIQAERRREMRKIMIAIDSVSPGERRQVEEYDSAPPVCSLEIWLQKHGSCDFEVEEIN